MKQPLFLFLFILLIPFTLPSFAQKRVHIVADIQQLMEQDKYKEAEVLLERRIPALLTDKNTDTLIYYPYYIGKAAYVLRGPNSARQKLEQFIEQVKLAHPGNDIILKCYLELSGFFYFEGNNDYAYTMAGNMEKYIRANLPPEAPVHAQLNINQGVYAADMGKYALASAHYRNALNHLTITKSADYELYFKVNNSMGISMWYAAKLDSTIYYFKQAEAYLSRMDSTPVNRYFRPAMLQNNMANVYNEQGQSTQAIQELEKAIYHYKTYIAAPIEDGQKQAALFQQFRSLDNLAKTYTDLGDYSKGQEMLTYAFSQKQKFLPENKTEQYKSMVNLGALYYKTHYYAKAVTHLQNALQLIYAANNRNNIWEAEALSYLAYSYFETEQKEKALQYLQYATNIYKKVVADDYSNEYLFFLAQASKIYALNNQPALALQLAQEAYNYTRKHQGEQSFSAVVQLLNVAEVNLLTQNYTTANNLSKQVLLAIKTLVAKSSSLMDSITYETNIPHATLVKIKSAYSLQSEKKPEQIQQYIQELNESVKTIERRKQILSNAENISTLMTGYMEVLDFIKRLELDLYNIKHDQSRLDIILQLHESAIYSKIRTRLNKEKDKIRFKGIPAEVIAKEAALIKAISLSLQNNRSHADNMQEYLRLSKDLNEFQKELKVKYPNYYTLKYELDNTLSIKTITDSLPAKTNVVRFLFIDKKLYALLLEKGHYEWVTLPDIKDMETSIQLLSDPASTPEQIFFHSNKLYQQLWSPLKKALRHTRITIIPDGILYYLNFDILTAKIIANYKDFATAGLIAEHAISYHYSLWAMLRPVYPDSKSRNSIATFTPGFTDEMKEAYKSSLRKDSFRIDNGYLSLLPLPFSTSLAQKTTRLFSGNMFTGEASTQQNFKQNAGHHAIIHIGTHAEANNEYPEYTRLIFAKDLNNPTNDNSIYLFDIYNYDLQSKLAVLTACETGKPGFFPGEGMVSMAHAFNYAGSESILTGLWKIDEQSSTIITQFFYGNLATGMTKDEALRQAKLSYLATAEGRMLAPQYWAGLVIMGDTSAINISKRNTTAIYWWIGAIFLITGIAGITFYRRSQKTAA